MLYVYQFVDSRSTWVARFSEPFNWSRIPGDKKEYDGFSVTFVGTETQKEE